LVTYTFPAPGTPTTMSHAFAHCCPLANGACRCHHNFASSYVVSPILGSTTLALTTHSPNSYHSPHLTPTFGIVNLPGSGRCGSPSPVIPTLLLTTPVAVDSLVAIDTEIHSHKVHYDVSKGLQTACISACGLDTPISNEQKNFPVVKGAPPNARLRIVPADQHPVLTQTIERDSSLTIGELIKLLHSYFHEPLGSEEASSLRSNVDLYPVAIKNQQKRCKAASDPDEEWSMGMKKIDVLGKECKFRGVELDAAPLTLYVAFGK